MDDGQYVEPSKLTLGDYLLNEWLPSLELRQIRPTTKTSYGSMVKQHVVPHIGQIPLQRLTPVNLNGLYADLRAHGRADGGAGSQ